MLYLLHTEYIIYVSRLQKVQKYCCEWESTIQLFYCIYWINLICIKINSLKMFPICVQMIWQKLWTSYSQNCCPLLEEIIRKITYICGFVICIYKYIYIYIFFSVKNDSVNTKKFQNHYWNKDMNLIRKYHIISIQNVKNTICKWFKK